MDKASKAVWKEMTGRAIIIYCNSFTTYLRISKVIILLSLKIVELLSKKTILILAPILPVFEKKKKIVLY